MQMQKKRNVIKTIASILSAFTKPEMELHHAMLLYQQPLPITSFSFASAFEKGRTAHSREAFLKLQSLGRLVYTLCK